MNLHDFLLLLAGAFAALMWRDLGSDGPRPPARGRAAFMFAGVLVVGIVVVVWVG